MTAEPLTITAFLEARIAEDEAVDYDRRELYNGGSEPFRTFQIPVPPPARVLAACKAHRAIVERFDTSDDIVIYPIVAALAAIWSDHEDFDPDWA